MKEKSTETGAASSPTWETLEAFARQSMQQLLQRTWEVEVDELLARARYERRAAIDAAGGYRADVANGDVYVNRVRAVNRGEKKAAT